MEALSLFMLLFLVLIGVVVGGAIYLVPTIIAVKADHPNKAAIIVLNILGGWTFIVWVLSLVWALTRPVQSQPVVNNSYYSPVNPTTAEKFPTNSYAHNYNPSEPLSFDGRPMLIGINGQFAGKTIDLQNGQVSIGRDPQFSQLAFSNHNDRISRRHCTVSFDQNSNRFILEDTSTNGTFIYPDQRLANGQPVYLEPGAYFFLADPEEMFEVSLS